MEPCTPRETPRAVAGAHEPLLRDAAARMFDMRRVLRPLIHRAKAFAAPALATHTSEAQIHILNVLAEETYLPAGKLAARCQVTNPTMSRMLTILESQGLVARTTDPANRRAVQVRLTGAGRRALEASRDALVAGLAQVLSPLTPEQLQDLIAALSHLESLIERDPEATHPEGHSDKERT